MKRKDSSGQKSEAVDFKAALRRAAELCSRQEQCTAQIREKLKRWNLDDEDVERILEKLQDERFIDDQRYASFFVKDKFKINQWGKVKIAYMLRQKGIRENDIQEALNQIDEDTYFQCCAALIQRKSASLKEKNLFARKGKLYKFAAGRGFEPDLIQRVLHTTGGV